MHDDLPGASEVCAQLGLAGWHALEVVDEIRALEAVRSLAVDVAVLHVPIAHVMDMDFPKILREVSPGSYLPVLIVADDPAEQERCRFLDSGADDVVPVGISAVELTARLRALLRIKKLNDQVAGSHAALEQALHRERALLAGLRKDNEVLKHLATTDPLTHAQNLRSFRDLLEHEFRMARRYARPLSLLMLDVDHFKVVNDAHGHPSGDYVLKELAVILKRTTRESDVVFRTGGEEFTVLLPKAKRAQAQRFAERIRKEVFARRFYVYDQNIHVTVSIGAATYPEDAEITEPEMLVQLADQALYRAKENGRDQVVAFHALDPAVRHRLRRQYAMRELAPPPVPGPVGTEIVI